MNRHPTGRHAHRGAGGQAPHRLLAARPSACLAAGWWLRFPGRYSFRRGLSLVNAEGTAFIDGPELDISDPPRLPDAGRATFAGGAGGFYRYRDGRLSNRPDADGNPRLVAGSSDVEFVEADGSQGQLRSLFTAVGESLLPPTPNPNP